LAKAAPTDCIVASICSTKRKFSRSSFVAKRPIYLGIAAIYAKYRYLAKTPSLPKSTAHFSKKLLPI
jgi:hypothetical protein